MTRRQIAQFTDDAKGRVVGEEVEPPMAGNRLVHQPLHLSRVSDIHFSDLGSPALAGDRGGDLLCALRIDVRDHDHRPATRQRLAQRAADAGGTARDHGRAILEVAHHRVVFRRVDRGPESRVRNRRRGIHRSWFEHPVAT